MVTGCPEGVRCSCGLNTWLSLHMVTDVLWTRPGVQFRHVVALAPFPAHQLKVLGVKFKVSGGFESPFFFFNSAS